MTISNDPLFNMLASELQAAGLGDLLQVQSDGTPSGWLWDQMQLGFDTSAELMLALEQTSVFKERFKVITEQKRRAAAGQPVYVMSPAEVIEYETLTRQAMAAAGMPEWFYDSPDDFTELILSDQSVAEVTEKIQQGFEYVRNAPIEVREAFSEFFGVANAEAALAAYVLDPDRTVAQLERATRTAYTAGLARRFDISLNKAAAQRIAELPRTEAGIVQSLETINAQSNLFDEGVFEATDLTAGREGVAAEFEGDADAITAMQRRATRRASINRAAPGGAAITARGVIGSGTAGGR